MNLAKKIQIGKLDRRIIIQDNTPTQDAYGARVDSWATYATRWAHLGTFTGQERKESAQVTSFESVVFTVRYDATTKLISAKMRVSYDSNLYEIITAYEKADSRNRYMILQCKLIE